MTIHTTFTRVHSTSKAIESLLSNIIANLKPLLDSITRISQTIWFISLLI